jgi:parallel beta-helix repeat protein
VRRFLSILLALGLVWSFSLAIAMPALAVSEVWVDDDFNSGTPGWGVDHFATIQGGIDAADSPGGIVHVAAGEYHEHHITLKNGVSVLGAGAAFTTIDGDNTDSVVWADGVGPGTTLDGFTITRGNSGVGGGMYIFNAATPVVSNCIFLNNQAFLFGGGMYILDGSSPTVANCIFKGNTTTLFNGGGICCWDSVSSTIINNTIVNNTAAAGYGGGIYANIGSSPNIINNIIVSNTATSGGGIFSDTGAAVINYNDIWSNTGGNYGGTASAGANDINPPQDPEFVDPGTGDYHLDETVPSPCIDVGDNSVVPGWLTTDFEGDPRIWDGNVDNVFTVDMGADEYYVPPPEGGSDEDIYYINDDVTVSATGFAPDSYVNIYVVDEDDWNAGDPIPADVGDGMDTIQADGSGNITNELIWSHPLELGEYDIVFDTNDNAVYDAAVDLVDDPHDPGFTVIAAPIPTPTPSPSPSRSVGGTVYPIDKAALLLPWLISSAALLLALAAGGLILSRRSKP